MIEAVLVWGALCASAVGLFFGTLMIRGGAPGEGPSPPRQR